MKKIIFMMICMVVGLTFMSCNFNPDDESYDDSTVTSVSTSSSSSTETNGNESVGGGGENNNNNNNNVNNGVSLNHNSTESEDYWYYNDFTSFNGYTFYVYVDGNIANNINQTNTFKNDGIYISFDKYSNEFLCKISQNTLKIIYNGSPRHFIITNIIINGNQINFYCNKICN